MVWIDHFFATFVIFYDEKSSLTSQLLENSFFKISSFFWLYGCFPYIVSWFLYCYKLGKLYFIFYLLILLYMFMCNPSQLLTITIFTVVVISDASISGCIFIFWLSLHEIILVQLLSLLLKSFFCIFCKACLSWSNGFSYHIFCYSYQIYLHFDL